LEGKEERTRGKGNTKTRNIIANKKERRRDTI